MAGEQESFTLSITVTANGYNMILQGLSAMPYNQVRALIDNIEEQAKMQVDIFKSRNQTIKDIEEIEEPTEETSIA
jgi:hypothetical protein